MAVPEKPGEKTFMDLVAVMTQHPNPQRSYSGFTCDFVTKERTVAMYLLELRALAQWCKFGDTLNDMLVCGVNEETS